MGKLNEFVDRLPLAGCIEKQKEIAVKRLSKLKQGDTSFLEYTNKKQKFNLKRWIKTTFRMMMYKVQNFKK